MIIVFNALEKGVTAVTIENLEIYMWKYTEHKVSISTKLIATEDNYSLHVEENLVPTGKGSNGVLSNIASFDNFSAIKIGAGEKMKIKVSCDTKCIIYNIVNNSMLVQGDHILVKGEKNIFNSDTMFRGAIFYKKKCENHKGKFIWKRKKEVNCKWISKEEKCSKDVAKQYCPKTCNVC